MATELDKKQISEADLNSPDIDDDGNLDPEHYPIPKAVMRDPYLRKAWDQALELLASDSSISEEDSK